VAAAAAGFLIWNWPPARIFMGDAGSGFLGFFVGSIAWATIVRGRLSIWVWLILLGAFIVDATVTLLRRWLRGAHLAEAHRSHAYQRLSRKYRSHLKVTLGILLINGVWLDPLAYAAAARPVWGAGLALLAWVPLIAVAWTAGAGTEEG
jgi:Fuc2NAc and GlcNAc transferase